VKENSVCGVEMNGNGYGYGGPILQFISRARDRRKEPVNIKIEGASRKSNIDSCWMGHIGVYVDMWRDDILRYGGHFRWID
jgi:hypothetical protein